MMNFNLFELGKILFCEVLNFAWGRLRCRFLLNKGGLRGSFKRRRPLVLSGAGFFWTTFFWASLTAWGLPEIGFLATGLVGMGFHCHPNQNVR
jgi:hypothetical protein